MLMDNETKVNVGPDYHEKFEDFLIEMDLVLDAFLMITEKAGFPLDYSLNSIQLLESYLLSYPNLKEEQRLQNIAARYLGEVFRKNIGGKWELCLKNPNYLYYMLPVITNYSHKSIEFCPIEVISNFTSSRDQGLLIRAVNAHKVFKR